MSQARTTVGLAHDLLRRLDERAAREGRSRSTLIQEAVKSYLFDEERDRISREIIEGYVQIPATEEEDPWRAASGEGR